MISRVRHLPPLPAIRVFEAAARHENFTAAANELGLTQAAVSYQMRVLEERLGTALFRREKKRVKLTEAGRRAAGEISRAFDVLDGAFAQLRTESDATLTVSTSTTFANTWFARRLGVFQMANPGMAVRLVASDALVDFAADEVDVAVRSGRGQWPGLVADRLIDIDFTPMCSPGFLAAHGGRLEPADLLTLPVISPQDDWWRVWLREAGVDVPGGSIRPGVRLDSQANEGAAAIAGQGMAVLTPFFWRDDVAEGRLVRPFTQVTSLGHGYWFVCAEHRRQMPKIKRFREWLLAEVASDLLKDNTP
jgi:LysR family glycine cleavage system transcriptional activator